MRKTNIFKFAFESMDTDKLICIDVEKEYSELEKKIIFSDSSIFYRPVKNISLGSSGRGCMLRTFSEDTFKPNLVPPYVKNISVVYDSENMKKYFTYVDDYGRGENNA